MSATASGVDAEVAGPPSSLVCAGCGATLPVAVGVALLACPNRGSGDDVDHVLRRHFDPARVVYPAAEGASTNPFVRYRELLHAYHLARALGWSDDAWVKAVAALDGAVAAVDGHGFAVTPYATADRLADRLGLAPGRLWIKDETGNVAGSHKARHLMGTLLHLLAAEGRYPQADGPAEAARVASGAAAGAAAGASTGAAVGSAGATGGHPPPLAIASCGNAALAAAVLARAAGRELRVFVPPWAEPSVQDRLLALGARIELCPRPPGVVGDPCYHRFRAAVGEGAVPFCCQGPDNGTAIEGGATLAWEILDTPGAPPPDRLLVQVGGGALASALALGFADAVRLGRIARGPRLLAVQTAGCFPLARAYDRVLAHLRATTLAAPPPVPTATPTADLASCEAQADAIRAAAAAPETSGVLREALRHAATHRSAFMTPWETEPASLASGILDDETYDWLAIVEAMLLTGGYPIVVDEPTVAAAHALGREPTGIDVCPTGTAGLAGLLRLRTAGLPPAGESVALLFTGALRS